MLLVSADVTKDKRHLWPGFLSPSSFGRLLALGQAIRRVSARGGLKLTPAPIDRVGPWPNRGTSRLQGSRSRVLLIFALLSGCFLVAGANCSQLPVEALHAYTDAFSRSREAGRRVYEAAEPAFARSDIEPAAGAEAEAAIVLPTLFPETLDRRARATDNDPDPHIQARIAAMDTVATYNEVMMQLASGATAEEVRGGVGRFADSALRLAGFAGLAIPGLDTILEAAKSLVAIAERARAEGEARRALLEGAPLIDAILKELDADIDRLYAVQRAYYQLEISGAAYFEVAAASNAILRFANRHVYPGDDSRAEERRELDRRFEAAWEGVEGEPPQAMLASVHGDGSAAPYDAAAHETLTGLMTALDAAAQNYRAKVRAWQAYQEALREYSALLASTKMAHGASVAAVKTPASSQEEFYRLLAIAGQVRGHAVTIIDVLGS
jgi:hypothetical protein